MNREKARELATQLVEQMTVEEMASQLRYDAPAIERLNIPAYNWWNEGLHGVARAGSATVFPQAIALGATFDKDLLWEVADVISTEARAKYNESIKHDDRDIYKGITLWSPNVNLFRDPRWGRGHETYGEDPELISQLAVSFIRGLQGDDKDGKKEGKEHLKTAACAKHFAVHSGPEALRHHFDAIASKKDMWETYLPAFENCVKDAEVESVMGAYNRTNGEPCCAHSYLMDDILRGTWDFQGHFVSDCWAVRDFHENHKVTKTPEESVILGLDKGCDLNCGCTYQNIMLAYKTGELPLEHIKRSAIRLFTTRYMLGMFEESEYDKIPYEVIECKEHLALSEKAAEEGIVLLKNDKNILPLKKDELKTVGVIGPNANSRVALIGNYHGTASRYITVTEGLQDYLGDDVRVLYAQGSHLYKDREEPLAVANDRIAEAMAVAEHSDVVILCLGLDETLEGEEGDTGNSYASGDKVDLNFPASQQELFEAVVKTGKPIVLCVMTGSAMDLGYATEHADAIMQVWYPGARGGKVIADILFGDKQPGGKLPITIYKDLEGMPEFEDYDMKGRTYRFLEKAPLYPFGYGIGYGKAEITAAAVDGANSFADLTSQDTAIKVTAKNTSDVAVNEVVQIYVQVTGTDDEVKNPRLVGFERVALVAGEEKTVCVKLPAKAWTTVDNDGNRSVTGNGCKIYAGFGQPDARTSELGVAQGKEIVF